MSNSQDIKYYDLQKIAWETPLKPAGRKLVFLCLAFHSDNFGASFPSIETIANETDQGKSTVKDHLKQLEIGGYIKRERQRYENGYLAGYRYYVQYSDLGLGPDYPHSYVQSSDHNKDQLKTNNNIIEGFVPNPLNPNTKTAKLASHLFTEDEMELFLERFIIHHTDKKTKSKDFNMQWRTWMQNQCQWRLEKSAKGNNGSRSAGRYVPVAQQRADAREEGIAAAEALLAEHGYE